MSNESKKSFFFGMRFLFEYSGFLIAGALAALIWANVDDKSYHHFVHFELKHIFAEEHHANDSHEHEEHHDSHSEHDDSHSEHQESTPHNDSSENSEHGESDKKDEHQKESDEESHSSDGEAHHGMTIHFLINDILMALFFAIAAKEVWEALLPGGALSNPRKAATPLLATVGGIAGPAAVYIGGAMLLGQMKELGGGWAIPCATDIAFSYLIARLIFGHGHPAIAFLLLLAIADDAAGLVILAVFYPDPNIDPNYWWLLLTVASMGLCFVFRGLRLHSFWWYLLIPGVACWYSFSQAGIHPALGLVPIIPCLPHAHTDLGLFAREELKRHDTLNEFEHWWKNPVEIILGLFGLVNAGVVFSSSGPGTWLVLAGLLIGKPVGITLFTFIAEKVCRLEIPGGMSYRHVFSLGMVAAIGFTVALFVSVAAFREPGPIQDSVKMGALLSFAAAAIAYGGARMLGIRAIDPSSEAELHEP